MFSLFINKNQINFIKLDFSFDLSSISDYFNFLTISLVRVFDKVEIKYNGHVVMTGYAMNIRAAEDANKTQFAVSGYSLCGILNDCTIPYESYPLQLKGLTVSKIISKMCGYADISVTDSIGLNEVIKEFNTNLSSTIGDIIISLSREFNFNLKDLSNGMLELFRISTDKKPVAYLKMGDGNVTSISKQIHGQGLFSNITATEEGGNTTHKDYHNKIGVKKHKVVVATQGSIGAVLKKEVNQAIKSEIIAVNLSEVLMKTSGELVYLQSESLEINGKFLILKNSFMVDPQKEKSSLELVDVKAFQ